MQPRRLNASRHGLTNSAAIFTKWPPHAAYTMEHSRLRALMRSLTNPVKVDGATPWYNPNSPELVEFDTAKVEAFIARSVEESNASFDAYVSKLVHKIVTKSSVEVVSAQLHGSNVWDYSLLSIVRESGEVEVWKTQRILNTSKYGLVFVQYRTNETKAKK
jgi:hypothetical protein